MSEGDEDFQYEDDDDEEDESATGFENKYYQAKSVKGDDPDDAIAQFEALVESEKEKGEW